jgi:site-specific recombinase XerD
VTLHRLVEQYIEFRQSLGERCQTNGCILRAFARTAGLAVPAAEVRTAQVDAFLAGAGPITSAWHIKHTALRGFYAYAVSRDYVAVAPLPTVIPKRPPCFVPYIYTREELRSLLLATDLYQRNRSCVEPTTVRTIVLLLYGSGLRVREAIALSRIDVDLEASVLTIRQTKFFKSRLVPVGTQLRQALARYAHRHRSHRLVREDDVPFFTTRTGAPMKQSTLEDIFQRVRQHAGVRRSESARYQPRLHDLRHTFAVHRLTSWYRQGLDVQRLLPHLSIYLGHAHLAATQVYLSMTPELLGEASARFERYAREECSP